MQQEAELIVKEIERLHGDFFNDYIFPFSIALFSSLLGFNTAYFTLKSQVINQINKFKLDVINKRTIMLHGALDNL